MRYIYSICDVDSLVHLPSHYVCKLYKADYSLLQVTTCVSYTKQIIVCLATFKVVYSLRPWFLYQYCSSFVSHNCWYWTFSTWRRLRRYYFSRSLESLHIKVELSTVLCTFSVLPSSTWIRAIDSQVQYIQRIRKNDPTRQDARFKMKKVYLLTRMSNAPALRYRRNFGNLNGRRTSQSPLKWWCIMVMITAFYNAHCALFMERGQNVTK